MPIPRSLSAVQEGVPVIRNTLFALLAAIIAAAVLITGAAPVDAAPRKVKLGISTSEGRHSPEALDEVMDDFAAEAGRRPAIWTLWSQWGNEATKQFPRELVDTVLNNGSVPLFFWEPVERQGLCTDHARFSKIANGQFDGYIMNWARAAKRLPKRNGRKPMVLLRFAHEINGTYFPWTVGSCGNTIRDYKRAWRRVHNLMRNKVGAKNIKFVWTVAKRPCPGGCNPYKAFYPGHRYVQFVGFSSFNWGNHFPTRKWTPMARSVSHPMKNFKQFTKKPVIIAELATNDQGGPTGVPSVDKPEWIINGYQAVYSKYPNIKAIVYLHEDLSRVNHPDWSLHSPGAMAGYEQVVANWKFTGHF